MLTAFKREYDNIGTVSSLCLSSGVEREGEKTQRRDEQMPERQGVKSRREWGRKQEVQNSCFSQCITLSVKTPPPENPPLLCVVLWQLCLNSTTHTDKTTVCYRWRDGRGKRQGKGRERLSENNPELQKSGSWGEVQQGRGEYIETEQRDEVCDRDRKESDRDIQSGWLILVMSDLVRSMHWGVLTSSSRRWWAMSRLSKEALTAPQTSSSSMFVLQIQFDKTPFK